MSCTCNTPNGRPPCSWCTRPLCVNCGGEVAADCEDWSQPLCEDCLAPAFEVVPEGPYCYKVLGATSQALGDGSMITVPLIETCPFWSKNDELPPHENGVCKLMALNDWESEKLTMLWDQVKECGLRNG